MFSVIRAFVALAAVAATTFGSPAVADQPDDTYAGQKCGMSSFEDPTGRIHEDSDVRTGEIAGGPWFVFGAVEVQVVCWLSVGDSRIDVFDPVVSGSSPGPVAAAVGSIDFDYSPGTPVYVCTGVYFVYANGNGGAVQFDQPCVREL